MIYQFNISTLAGTSELSPKKTKLKLEKGIIHKLEVDFPSGSQHNLRLRILEGGHVAWPRNPSSDFRGDNVLIEFREHYPMTRDPLELWAHTWNTDDTNNHVLIIRIGMLPKTIITPWLLSWKERIQGGIQDV